MSSQTSTTLEYRLYCHSDADAITLLLADVFPRHDPLAFAVDITAADFAAFVQTLLPQAGDDGLTVVACHAPTGEIVGALLTNDPASEPTEALSELNEKFGPVAGILGELDDLYLAGREPRPGDMLHLYLLGVSDRFTGQGVGQQLVARTMENGLRRGYRVAYAEATNRTSQHIFRKLGFREHAQLLYRDHLYRGQNVFAGIAQHGGAILMEKLLIAP